jgi:hypothetical protein
MASDAYLFFDKLTGKFKERVIDALNIKSIEADRNFGFFVNEEDQFMYWVGWSKEKANGKFNKPYFRRYASTPVEAIQKARQERKHSKESQKHKLAKRYIKEALKQCVADNRPLTWAFKNKEISQFPLKGNLLRGVRDVSDEYRYHTAVQKEYRFDVALLGPTLVNHPIVLGAIEIENSCRFDIEKTIVCKTLGFPLISIDVTETPEEQLSPQWALDVLTQTRKNHTQQRKNYFYIHLSLYPLFLSVQFSMHNAKEKHQYIVFASDEDLKYIEINVSKLATTLGMEKDVDLSLMHNKNNQTKAMFKNHGSIAGPSWRNYNENKFLLITIKRDFLNDDRNYFFHLTLARLLNAHTESLVGYKPYKGAKPDLSERVWKESCIVPDRKKSIYVPTLPKSVSEPTLPLKMFLRSRGLAL